MIFIVMKDVIRKILRENIQQADKIYFKDGKMPPEVRERILAITNGDAYTKLVSDLIYWLYKMDRLEKYADNAFKSAEEFYEDMVNYDKNVLPVKYDFNAYSEEKDRPYHITDLWSCLRNRRYAVRYLKSLPSIIIRNLKNFIRTPEDNEYAFDNTFKKLRTLSDAIGYLPKDEAKRATLLNKIASSKNNLDQMIEIAQHFNMAYTGNEEEIGKEELIDLVDDLEAEITQNSGSILVIKVNSYEAMQSLGCTSTWCFARPNGEEWWDSYAQLGYVYIIFDFSKTVDDALFMMTYLPIEGAVYASTNVPVEDLGADEGTQYLEDIGVDFGALSRNDDNEEPHPAPAAPKPKPRKQPQGDPNQLSLALETRKLIKKLLRNNLV